MPLNPEQAAIKAYSDKILQFGGVIMIIALFGMAYWIWSLSKKDEKARTRKGIKSRSLGLVIAIAIGADKWTDSIQLPLAMIRSLSHNLHETLSNEQQTEYDDSHIGWNTSNKMALEGPVKDADDDGIVPKLAPLAFYYTHVTPQRDMETILDDVEHVVRKSHDSDIAVSCSLTHVSACQSVYKCSSKAMNTAESRRYFLGYAALTARANETRLGLVESRTDSKDVTADGNVCLSVRLFELLRHWKDEDEGPCLDLEAIKTTSRTSGPFIVDTLTMAYALFARDTPSIETVKDASRIGGQVVGAIVGSFIGGLKGKKAIVEETLEKEKELLSHADMLYDSLNV